MAVALEQFIKQLENSGVLAAGKLESFIPPQATPKDAQELARQLVQSKQLTKYQAQEIYQGRAKSLILGNYTILDKIGAGGMGQVFKAEHRRLKRVVAIKMLPKAMLKDASAVARFQREVEAAARLRHSNVVATDDADEADGVHFLVMEYVEGQDLSALVKKNGPLSLDKALNYVLQSARGLEFAHGEGVIHRDIKPANLLLDKKGTVKILDMGLARIEASADAATQAELTGTGAVMGTVDYMAPEQALSTKHATAQSDIYSLGCTLHYLVTGRSTYEGESLMARLLAHREEPIPSLGAELPPDVQAVFAKMVAKTVGDRYQSMAEVVEALQTCNTAGSTQAIAPPTIDTSPSSDVMSFLRNVSAKTFSKPKPQAKVDAKPQASPASNRVGKRKIALIAAGLLGLAVLGGVIFKLRTPDGTLVVEIDQPDAVVEILNEAGKVEITRPGEKGTVSISVDPGKHRLKVEKDGFAVYGRDFVMESGGTQTIKATLEQVHPWPADAVSFGSKRFKLHQQSLDWKAAQKSCAAVGGRLAEVRSQAENDFLVNMVKQSGVDGVWLGATDEREEGRWLWSDGSPLGYANWDQGQPNNFGDGGENHLMLLISLHPGTWWDQPAESGRGLPENWKVGYVCEWDDAANTGSGEPQKSWLKPDFVKWQAEVARLPAEQQIKAVAKKLQELNPEFDGKLTDGNGNPPQIESGFVKLLGFVSDSVTDISPVRVLKDLFSLSCNGSGRVKGQLSDLSPLKGMSLAHVQFSNSKVSDLSPLAGMPLETVTCINTNVGDLSPLKGMRLEQLWASYSPYTDLTPLKVAPLRVLSCDETGVADLSPLQGMKLERIHFTCAHITRGMSAIREMKTLATIGTGEGGGFPAEEFWKKYDAGEFGKPIANSRSIATFNDPAFKKWEQEVAALPAEEQVKAVAKKLHELNPGFDGKVNGRGTDVPPKIENGAVTEFGFRNDRVTDLSPVRALKKLRNLYCARDEAGRGELQDLSPLQGMRLNHVNCSHSKVSDLSPLIGMPLLILAFNDSFVTDLSALRGMPLQTLMCEDTTIADFSALAGMKLTELTFSPEKIIKGIDTVRQMESLDDIGLGWGKEYFSRERFWKKYDAGDFGKPAPATTASGSFNTPAFKKWENEVAALPADEQLKAVSKKLVELNPGFDGKLSGWKSDTAPKIENGQVTQVGFFTDNVTDLSPVRALRSLRDLWCACRTGSQGKLHDLAALQGMNLRRVFVDSSPIDDLSPLKGMSLTYLSCGTTPVKDLSPLKGMPLEYLNCGRTNVANLSPLQGMPLTTLFCDVSQVADLLPLKGMKLESLVFHETPVSDLSPLSGMPLKRLVFNESQVTDLSPIKGMNLEFVAFTPARINKGIDSVRRMESLKEIGFHWDHRFPPQEFWKKYDAGEFGKPTAATTASDSFDTPAFKKWEKETAALPAAEQLKAVAKKLQELNPSFDGKLAGLNLKGAPTIVDGVVTELGVAADEVTDLSPVRVFVGLKNLDCRGSNAGKGKLSDLRPLKGMQLQGLICGGTKVSDLSPLQGMPLVFMNCGTTAVADLSPLKGMPLTYLHCDATRISDLSPLRGMPLNDLLCNDTQVTDLSALEGMELENFGFTPKNITKGLDVIRQNKTIKTIALGWDQTRHFAPAEFWKKYDAGEFNK